jgi:DGQHR domain-containing protein
MIVEETDINRIHQDFADCAQTKAIPPSLLTLYDHRDDLSRLTRDVVDEVPFFRGRIEKVGKTVAKNSQNLYTLNQVRVAVAEILIGDASATSATVRSKCSALLNTQTDYDTWSHRIVEFFNELSGVIPEWTGVTDSNDGGPAFDVTDFRSKSIHFTGTGLTVIGRVAHEILSIQNPVETPAKSNRSRNGSKLEP